MPSYPHIERYHAALQRLIDFSGSDREQNIRRAFENCLDSYCYDHRESLALIAELPTSTGVKPDGTVVDFLRLPRGYWEAKDSQDDLFAEIRRKFSQGYPQDNIIFEDSRRAILLQHGAVAMEVDMSSPADLHRLIEAFLNYVTREVEDFRTAWQQFKDDMPTILSKLREDVANAAQTNDMFRTAADSFLELCRRTISADVTEFDVQEMLIQHTLTKDIFLRVFSEDQFHQENNIASQLDALERSFMTGDLRRETIGKLLPYYTAITAAAVAVADYHEKQQFLKAIYEDFYKAYNPAAADRLGVVYTPNEIVDFIIRGADHLLQEHFGRRLADRNVQILDPATGTGTFVTNLIDYLPEDRLEYKYLNEIHANEVAILPYYIANLNIEYTYKEKMGRYLEFPNLCFVDTLDNMDWRGATGAAVARQASFNLGGLSVENWMRVQLQNEKPISVIIGNPPYNDSATLWGDLTENRGYYEIDRRISETYVAVGTAQRTHQYDMYKRFIRWASDRLTDDGVIGFVSNSAFLESRQDDGFRKVVAEEFSELWVIDLKGNARTSGERRRREKGNIFEDKIRVGIAIYFLVRRKGAKGFRVFHNAVDDYLNSRDKVDYIKGKTLPAFEFKGIAPAANGDWLNQSNSDFDDLLPLANKETKLARTVSEEQAVFGLVTNAVKSNRDDWVYDFDKACLRNKARFFAEHYNELLEANDQSDSSIIKWSHGLKDRFRRHERISYRNANLVQSLWRPFVRKFFIAEAAWNDRLTRNHYAMFGSDFKQSNKAINVCVNGKDFYAVGSDRITDYHFTGDTQCLPLYRYTDEGDRASNIMQWGIDRINDHYRKKWGEDFGNIYPSGIAPDHIFAYTYAVLHDPVYRHDYAIDLTREFPRLPLYHDFQAWERMGQELLDLHIGFESAEPYPLQQIDQFGHAKRVILRADKEGGRIVLDDKTTLTGVPADAWRYRLGSRSALEWVLDQYKERKPRDPTIAERFNTYRFADYKVQVIDLLRRVCTVSVRTMEIVDDMAGYSIRRRDEYLDEG